MNEVKATMSPSSLLSLKEVVIDYKIKTNEQSWQTWTGRWGSRIGILEEWMFNPRDDACTKPPEPTAWIRETLTLRETKISLPSQHSKKLLGMRCVELGQLSEDQRLQRTTQGARLQNRQLPQGWGSSNVKKKKKKRLIPFESGPKQMLFCLRSAYLNQIQEISWFPYVSFRWETLTQVKQVLTSSPLIG